MRLLILGTGAIGSNLARFLAADMGDGVDVALLDYDKVEDRNVRAGTQFFYPDQVGMPKVEALQYNIYKATGYTPEIFNYEVIDPEGLTVLLVNETLPRGETEVIFDPFDLVIDCFDNQEAREAAQEACFKTQIPCVHIGFSPQFTFEIEWNDEYKVPETAPEEFDICERVGAAGFVNMVAALGSIAVQEWLMAEKQMRLVGNRYTVREVK